MRKITTIIISLMLCISSPAWCSSLAEIRQLPLQQIQEQAEMGNKSAQTAMGIWYLENSQSPEDLKESIYWFKLAAVQNCHIAQNNLAVAYQQGLGIESNPQEALSLLVQAAKGGNSAAQYNLGIFYRTQEQSEEANAWFLHSAINRCANAHYQLAKAYTKGIGMPVDKEAAIKWYQYAAQGGVNEAMIDLAQIYYQGWGSDPDYGRSFELLSKAANLNNAQAQYRLGVMYLEGIATSYDFERACHWLEQAANQNHQDAIETLHNLYWV